MLLLIVSCIAVTTFAFDYYVVPEDSQSCPSDNECHNLFYCVSYFEQYFTSNSTIFFLEGEHKLEREDHVLLCGIDSQGLRLKDNGWKDLKRLCGSPLSLSTAQRVEVEISFGDSDNIAVIEMLTMINCGSHASVFCCQCWKYLLSIYCNTLQHESGNQCLQLHGV